MSSVTIGQELASALAQLKERTEIRDSQGKLLGIFTPQVLSEKERFESLFNLKEAEQILAEEKDQARPLERLDSLFSLEEAERIAATDREAYSLSEVKEYLRSLENQG